VQNSASYGSLAANDQVMSVTLQAQWMEGKVALFFDANGGLAPAGTITVKIVGYGMPVGTLPSPGAGAPVWADGSYVFLGWATTPNASVPDFSADYVVNFEPTKTVYAVWGI
jgi:hypothetical protein